jgi:hypothetical protein
MQMSLLVEQEPATATFAILGILEADLAKKDYRRQLSD